MNNRSSVNLPLGARSSGRVDGSVENDPETVALLEAQAAFLSRQDDQASSAFASSHGSGPASLMGAPPLGDTGNGFRPAAKVFRRPGATTNPVGSSPPPLLSPGMPSNAPSSQPTKRDVIALDPGLESVVGPSGSSSSSSTSRVDSSPSDATPSSGRSGKEPEGVAAPRKRLSKFAMARAAAKAANKSLNGAETSSPRGGAPMQGRPGGPGHDGTVMTSSVTERSATGAPVAPPPSSGVARDFPETFVVSLSDEKSTGHDVGDVGTGSGSGKKQPRLPFVPRKGVAAAGLSESAQLEIHHENVAKIESMDPQELQDALAALKSLPPGTLEMLRSRSARMAPAPPDDASTSSLLPLSNTNKSETARQADTTSSTTVLPSSSSLSTTNAPPSSSSSVLDPPPAPSSSSLSSKSTSVPAQTPQAPSSSSLSTYSSSSTAAAATTSSLLPPGLDPAVRENLESVKVESDKLAWMAEPATSRDSSKGSSRPPLSSLMNNATTGSTSQADLDSVFANLQADSSSAESGAVSRARFDFEGRLMTGEDLPSSSGLMHHGDDPTEPGYTLGELFTLARSSVPTQRTLALRVLTRILTAAKRRAYPRPMRVVAYLTHTLRLPLLLRMLLDDGHPSTAAAAVVAMATLVLPPSPLAHAAAASAFVTDSPPSPAATEDCDPEWASWRAFTTEDVFSIFTSLWWRAASPFPLTPEQEIEEGDEGLTDAALCSKDLIKGLSRMNTFVRLRWLLAHASWPVPNGMEPLDAAFPYHRLIFAILTRAGRHGPSMCKALYTTPELIDTVLEIGVLGPLSVGRPVIAEAIRLVWVICQGNAHAAADLVAGKHVMRWIPRLISSAVSELSQAEHTPSERVLEAALEALRLWRVLTALGRGAHAITESTVILQALVAPVSAAPNARVHPWSCPSAPSTVSMLVSSLGAAVFSLWEAQARLAAAAEQLKADASADGKGLDTGYDLIAWSRVTANTDVALALIQAHSSSQEPGDPITSRPSTPPASSPLSDKPERDDLLDDWQLLPVNSALAFLAVVWEASPSMPGFGANAGPAALAKGAREILLPLLTHQCPGANEPLLFNVLHKLEILMDDHRPVIAYHTTGDQTGASRPDLLPPRPSGGSAGLDRRAGRESIRPGRRSRRNRRKMEAEMRELFAHHRDDDDVVSGVGREDGRRGSGGAAWLPAWYMSVSDYRRLLRTSHACSLFAGWVRALKAACEAHSGFSLELAREEDLIRCLRRGVGALVIAPEYLYGITSRGLDVLALNRVTVLAWMASVEFWDHLTSRTFHAAATSGSLTEDGGVAGRRAREAASSAHQRLQRDVLYLYHHAAALPPWLMPGDEAQLANLFNSVLFGVQYLSTLSVKIQDVADILTSSRRDRRRKHGVPAQAGSSRNTAGTATTSSGTDSDGGAKASPSRSVPVQVVPPENPLVALASASAHDPLALRSALLPVFTSASITGMGLKRANAMIEGAPSRFGASGLMLPLRGSLLPLPLVWTLYPISEHYAGGCVTTPPSEPSLEELRALLQWKLLLTKTSEYTITPSATVPYPWYHRVLTLELFALMQVFLFDPVSWRDSTVSLTLGSLWGVFITTQAERAEAYIGVLRMMKDRADALPRSPSGTSTPPRKANARPGPIDFQTLVVPPSMGAWSFNFFEELVTSYSASSFGDAPFSAFLSLIMMGHYPIEFRQRLWTELPRMFHCFPHMDSGVDERTAPSNRYGSPSPFESRTPSPSGRSSPPVAGGFDEILSRTPSPQPPVGDAVGGGGADGDSPVGVVPRELKFAGRLLDYIQQPVTEPVLLRQFASLILGVVVAPPTDDLSAVNLDVVLLPKAQHLTQSKNTFLHGLALHHLARAMWVQWKPESGPLWLTSLLVDVLLDCSNVVFAQLVTYDPQVPLDAGWNMGNFVRFFCRNPLKSSRSLVSRVSDERVGRLRRLTRGKGGPARALSRRLDLLLRPPPPAAPRAVRPKASTTHAAVTTASNAGGGSVYAASAQNMPVVSHLNGFTESGENFE